MKVTNRRSMRWIKAMVSVMALALVIILPQKATGFVVKAETVETGGSASGDILSSDKLADAGDKVAVGDAGEDQDADEEPTIPGATVEVLNEENFERVTQAATGATTGDWFVKFYAPWCRHCKLLEPTWDELAGKLGGEVNVAKVDVTANKRLGNRFGIKGFPTLLMISHGRVYKFTGARKIDTLLDFAKGGFKEATSEPVPVAQSFADRVLEMLNLVVEDLKGIIEGKMPSPITLMIFMMSLLVVIVIISFVSTPSPSRRQGPGAARAKTD